MGRFVAVGSWENHRQENHYGRHGGHHQPQERQGLLGQADPGHLMPRTPMQLCAERRYRGDPHRCRASRMSSETLPSSRSVVRPERLSRQRGGIAS